MTAETVETDTTDLERALDDAGRLLRAAGGRRRAAESALDAGRTACGLATLVRLHSDLAAALRAHDEALRAWTGLRIAAGGGG